MHSKMLEAIKKTETEDEKFSRFIKSQVKFFFESSLLNFINKQKFLEVNFLLFFF